MSNTTNSNAIADGPTKPSGDEKSVFVIFNDKQRILLDTVKTFSLGLSKKEITAVLSNLASEINMDLVPAGQVRVSSVISSMSAQRPKEKVTSKVPKTKSKDSTASEAKPKKSAFARDPLYEEFIRDEGKDLNETRKQLKADCGSVATAEQKAKVSQATAALRAAYGIFRDHRSNSSGSSEERPQEAFGEIPVTEEAEHHPN